VAISDQLALAHYVHFGFFRVDVRIGARPEELRGFRWDRDTPRSFAELREDLVSAYPGRRYQAMYDLRESTALEAAPLFRLALGDENRERA
jgi:hypothetical protein